MTAFRVATAATAVQGAGGAMERGPWAWLASGEGWRGAGDVPSQGAWGVREAAIIERVSLRLRGDGSQADVDAAMSALRVIDELAGRGLAIAGCWSFELGAALERLPIATARGRGPQRLATCDDIYVLAFDPADVESCPAVATPSTATAVDVRPSWQRQRAAFVAEAAAIGEAIAAGAVYQVNLSRVLPVEPRQGRHAFAADPARTLASLQASQAVPFAALLELRAPGRRSQRLISGSMELFLAVDRGDPASGPNGPVAAGENPAKRDATSTTPAASWRLRTRPIKGTTPRGDDPVADDVARGWLQRSTKERAENAMIVDMARNDLGRVAVVGSVTVPMLLRAVPYQTLWHLESEVHARLAAGCGRAALLAATLPPASVSGAPKIAAMRAIAALERRRRGPYCGAIGVFWPDGSARLSVGIRVVLADATGAELAVGAGIVADSEPAAEWRELLLKANASQRWLAALADARAESYDHCDSADRATVDGDPADHGVADHGAADHGAADHGAADDNAPTATGSRP